MPPPTADPRTIKAAELILKDPTLMVTRAMQAAGFTVEESRDRAKQMCVRRRTPSKKDRNALLQLVKSPPPNSNTNTTTISPQASLTSDAAAIVDASPSSSAAGAAVGGALSVQQSLEPEWSVAGGVLEVAGDEFEELQDWLFSTSSLHDRVGDVGGMKQPEGVDNVEEELLNVECTLREWISFQRLDVMGGQRGGGDDDGMPVDIISKQRRHHLEEIVQILYSLAVKIVGEVSGDSMLDIGDKTILVHPQFITMDNIVVRKSTTATVLGREHHGQISVSADLIRFYNSPFCRECNEDETNKYSAMHAFARIAYAMCMMGDGPTFPDSPRRNITSSETSISTALRLNDDADDDADGGVDEEVEIMDMIRKQYRVAESEEINDSGFISAMTNAGIPFPMRRFISDLLGDERGNVFRSDRAFSSFDDVISDLKQMAMYPDRFLHGAPTDRWKIVFDGKLYGRDTEMEALMTAADRVIRIKDGSMGDKLSRLAGRKSEVVMISGHSGAGKSCLVKLGGACLEKKGWLFLRCKFDQGVHPEPLSVLTHALDDYLRSLTLCSKCGIHHSRATSSSLFPIECPCLGRFNDVCARLRSMIFPQGLGILARYIPSLRILLDVGSPVDLAGLNQTMMASLLCKLLQSLSSEHAPVLFFLDDLQWADLLSLSVIVEIAKEVSPDLNSFGNGSQTLNVDEEAYIMLVGSYRDKEVDSNHPLAKILHKFRSDNTINVTDISLSGLSHKSLNEMLSDTLSLPVRRVRPLTELVIQKTDGHPLHVMEFIQALTVNNLLTHSFSKGWEWDVDSIDIFPITDSVAELYSFKLQRMSKETLLGIQILSCFGFQVDQQVLDFVADYDGEASVDMSNALQVAVSEGLVERAGQLISFTHDMILKAAIESIHKDDLIPLLRKLITVLVKEATVAGALDSVLFVAVDLINRVGSEFTTVSNERALFAELNLRAGMAAIAVPDFVGAATYAENGISFLSDTCWETQYDLCVRLYETSVLSHFPSLTGDRSKLIQRIKDVFEHARDFSDKFKTHVVWIQLLSATDISKGIDECLTVLEKLGEPLDLDNVDHNRVRFDIEEQKLKYSDLSLEGILSIKRLIDLNKVRAMKVMSKLLFLCHATNLVAASVSCKMVNLSMKYGTSDDSILGVAAFASALVNISGCISEGIAWGRAALLMLKLSGDKPTLIPPVFAAVYGSILMFADPIQSTLEPLSQCVRFAYDTGNLEYSIAGVIYYLIRSFSSGKNIRVLIGEVDISLKMAGSHFGNDSSFKTPSYNIYRRFFFAPLYRILFEFEGDTLARETLFPVDLVQPINNHDTLVAAIELKRYNVVMAILIMQAPCALLSRNMDMALTYSNMYFEHIMDNPNTTRSGSVSCAFYDGLVSFFFLRQTGDGQYKVRGERALSMMEELVAHSEWNFKNKHLLLKAEFHYSMKQSNMAAVCYKSSIEAAKKHKLIHEEALANELAGLFFLDEGQRQESLSFFEQSTACYQAWGAFAIARRIDSFIEQEFRIS